MCLYAYIMIYKDGSRLFEYRGFLLKMAISETSFWKPLIQLVRRNSTA